MGRYTIQSFVMRLWCKRKRKNASKYDCSRRSSNPSWPVMLGQEFTGSTKPAAAEGEGDGTYQTGKGKSKAGVVRVKMVLTKAEVARLLAVGVSAAEEAVAEHLATALERLGKASGRPGGPWRPALESIPETV